MRLSLSLPLVLFAAAVFMVASPVTAMEYEYFEMTIDPPSGSNNQVDIAVDISYKAPIVGWVNLDDTANDVGVSGNLWTRLGIDFDPVTQVASVQNVEFDGGSFVFDTVNMNFGFNVIATGTGIGGTFDTETPPAPMLNATQFDTSHHKVILNQGTFTYDTPVQDGSFNLATDPVSGTANATGSITVGSPSISGNTATYAVELILPLNYDEDLDTGNADLKVSVDASGTFVAHGTISRTIPYLPVAVNDPRPGYDADYTVAEDNTLNIPIAQGVLVNDTDPNGDELSAIKISDPAHGSVALNPNGSLVYTPDANWYGTDTFTYKAFDGTNYSENAATVEVTVDPVLDVPDITISHEDHGSVGDGLRAYTLKATGIGITSLAEFTIDGAVNQVFNGGEQTEWLSDGSASVTEETDSYVIIGNQRIPDQGDTPIVITLETINDGSDSGLGTLNNSIPGNHDIYFKTGTPSPDIDTVDLMYLVLPENGGVEIDFTLMASMYHGLVGPGISDVSSQTFTYVLGSSIPGDANRDGIVNAEDAAAMAANWLTTGAGWSGGDFNDDGIVNEADATLLAANWQTPSSQASVPEPSTIAMLVLGALCLIGYRTRK